MRALVKLYADRQLTADERLSEDQLLDILEEALDARVVEELPDVVGRYQFTHALLEQTLADELSTSRRVRWTRSLVMVAGWYRAPPRGYLMLEG